MRGTDPWMKGTVEQDKQSATEVQRDKRAKRSRGHIKEQGGGSEGNGDKNEERKEHIAKTEEQVCWRAEKRQKS